MPRPPTKTHSSSAIRRDFGLAFGSTVFVRRHGAAALRADDHDLAGIDRGFGLDDAALILLVFRLLVLRGDVHALHDDLAALRVSRQDFAFLALVLTGQDNDFIVFLMFMFCALLK